MPDPLALDMVVSAFADTTHHERINLHIDLGQAGPQRYNLGGGNSITHREFFPEPNKGLWETFEDLKDINFNPGRYNAFHYNIWAHSLFSFAPDASGISQSQDSGQFTDDFIISLGGPFYSDANFPGQQKRVLQAGTFMHELGHNLNLDHGGNDPIDLKPNYRSVMSRRYQVEGIDNNCQVGGDGLIDYSHGSLIGQDLRERNGTNPALDENVGMCNGVAVDWNMNGTIDQQLVEVNINCPPRPDLGQQCSQDPIQITGEIQSDHDDWNGGLMRFDFQNSPWREYQADGGAAGFPGSKCYDPDDF